MGSEMCIRDRLNHVYKIHAQVLEIARRSLEIRTLPPGMASPSQENGKVANGTNGETLPSLEASNSPRNPDGCKKDDTMNDRFNNTSLLSHVEPYSYKGTEAEAARWQWLFSPSDMAFTPSVLQSSLTEDRERYNRWKGVQLILRIGDYMRMLV